MALNGLMHKSGPEYLPENLDATREQAANRELDYRGFLAEALATDEWNGWPWWPEPHFHLGIVQYGTKAAWRDTATGHGEEEAA